MNKKQYFLEAMNAGLYKNSPWVISLFSVAKSHPDSWKKDPYPYRLVTDAGGFFYVNPTNPTQLVQIDPYTPGEEIQPDGARGLTTSPGTPLYSVKEELDLKLDVDPVPNLVEDVHTTTYGQLLANYILLIYPFGKKFHYINAQFNAPNLEQIIADRLQSNPEEILDRDVNAIYVDELLKFNDAAMSLTAFTQICVPAATEKTITPPPGIQEYRAQLLMQYADRLHDPAIIALIDKKLVEYHKQYMKGDLGEGFLISGKSYEVVRKELYLMGGAAAGLDEAGTIHLVKRSLVEGWDPEDFAAMATVSRAGSFSRGAETEKGGEETKWLFRASSNMAVTDDNCGSVVGIDVVARPGQERNLVGFTVIKENGNQKVITQEDVGEYMGRRIFVRSPMFCRTGKTDYCKICVGPRLANNPTSLSTAVAAYGSAFMGIAMSMMHATALKTSKLDYTDAFR